ncbi:MAG: phage tail tube protein [Acinetobacter sp.]|nr:phage tail tube protein [Acinetobacter sp.]
MSSGARVVTAYAVQTDKAVLPTAGWKILPNISNGLTTTTELTESEHISGERIKKSGMVTSGEIAGEISAELQFGTYDDFIQGAFFNSFKAGRSNTDPAVLEIGTTPTWFAVSKDFTDVNTFYVFSGLLVNSFKLEINTSDLIKINVGLKGLGYQASKTQSFSKTPAAAVDSAKASGQSIGTILLDGADIGVCVESFSFELDNALEVQKCLGSNIYGGNLLPMMPNISGSMTIAYSQKAFDILEAQRTGATLSLELPITFANGKKYTLKIPKMQVSGDIPSPSGTDLVTAEISYNVVDISPKLERV